MEEHEIQSLAKKAAGNWKEFNFGCTVWYDEPEDSDKFMWWNISSRDSDIVEQSNWLAIQESLKDFPDVTFTEISHWAHGYTNTLIARVFNSEGNITDAFREIASLREALNAYSILDEGIYESLCNEILAKEWDKKIEQAKSLRDFYDKTYYVVIHPDKGYPYLWVTDEQPPYEKPFFVAHVPFNLKGDAVDFCNNIAFVTRKEHFVYQNDDGLFIVTSDKNESTNREYSWKPQDERLMKENEK